MSSDLSVLHLYGSYYPGSDGNMVHPLLLERGIESYMAAEVVFRRDLGLPPNAFVRNHGSSSSVSRAPIGRVLTRIAPNLLELRSRRFYRRIAEEVRPSVLNAHWGPIGHSAMPLSRSLGVPLITTFYGYDASAMIRVSKWVARYRALVTGSAAIVVLSEEVKTRFVRLGCDPQKVIVWDLPISLDRITFRRRPTDGPLRVLAIARFVPKKGYPTMLRAIAASSDARGPVSLTAVGYGPDLPHMEKLATELKIAERVRFVDTRPFDTGDGDFLSFLQPLLDSHHVCVMPSIVGPDGDDEGGPALSMVYAQAAGMPVVCTPFPGHERTVTDGRSGLVVPMDDPAALARALTWLAASRDQWDRLGEAGNRAARERFDQNASIDRIIALYRSVAAGTV